MTDRSAPPSPDSPALLLPHGPSMVFVDRVLAVGPQHAVCRVVPGGRDAAWVEDGLLPAAMAIEYMGQAMCVFASLRPGAASQRAIGYIIAVRGLTVTVPGFRPGEPLTVTATHRGGDDRLARFDTAIERDGQSLARAVLTVFHPTAEELA